MKVNDFMLCTFVGDTEIPPNTFVAEITEVDSLSSTFKCYLRDTGQKFSFTFSSNSSGPWYGTDDSGVEYEIDTHDIYTAGGIEPYSQGGAVVTFNDNKRFLCLVESVDPSINVHFYNYPFAEISFKENQIIKSNWIIYPEGSKINSIEGYILNQDLPQIVDLIYYFVPDVYIIPVIAQPKSMACWAAVITMLMSWKNKICYTIETAMDLLGDEFRKIYEDNTGLFPDKMEKFTYASQTIIEWPRCETPESILQLLQNYGPLVIVNDEDSSPAFAVHARMVTGIYGDGTNEKTFLKIIDPAGGKTYNEAFNVFQSKYESMAAARGWNILMMHY